MITPGWYRRTKNISCSYNAAFIKRISETTIQYFICIDGKEFPINRDIFLAANTLGINGMTYARNEITTSLSIKKSKTDDGEETTIKIHWNGDENIFDVSKKLQEYVAYNKESKNEYQPNYTKSFIGVKLGDKPSNFFTITPQKKAAVLYIKVKQSASLDKAIRGFTKTEIKYSNGGYSISLTSPDGLSALVPVILQAESEFFKK